MVQPFIDLWYNQIVIPIKHELTNKNIINIILITLWTTGHD